MVHGCFLDCSFQLFLGLFLSIRPLLFDLSWKSENRVSKSKIEFQAPASVESFCRQCMGSGFGRITGVIQHRAEQVSNNVNRTGFEQ